MPSAVFVSQTVRKPPYLDVPHDTRPMHCSSCQTSDLGFRLSPAGWDPTQPYGFHILVPYVDCGFPKRPIALQAMDRPGRPFGTRLRLGFPLARLYNTFTFSS